MSGKQLAVQVTNFNREQPEASIEVNEIPIPEPSQGQVLVRITLRPINPADVFSIQGVYPGFTPKEVRGSVPGLDGVGVVEKQGPGASKYAPGTRVFGAPWDTKSGNGTWCQYQVIDEKNLIAVPEKLSDDAAAQVRFLEISLR